MNDQDFETALTSAIQPVVDQAGRAVQISFTPVAPAEVTFNVQPTPPQA